VTPPTPGPTTTAGDTTPAGPNPCEGLNGVFVTDPNGDCQDYLSCSDGVAYPQRCPDGYFFDVANQYCNYWDVVVCGDSTDPCFGKPQNSFVPRPDGTCSSYYRCDYGVGIPLDCPDGLFFDEALAACNHPDLVDCEDPGQPTAPTVPTTTEMPTTTTQTTTIPTAPTATSTVSP
jgi:Chitin binding Peritrophin-A domain